MPTIFQPAEDFEATVAGRSQVYRKEQTYTVRPGNHALAEAVQGWLALGRVRLAPSVAPKPRPGTSPGNAAPNSR